MANKQPLVLVNGVYLRTNEYNTKAHLDSADVMQMNHGHQKVTDLGLITPFVNAGYLVNPQLYTFSNLGQNRVELDGHLFKFSHPVAEKPFFVVEDLSGQDKPGLAGEKFRVKFNHRKYDNGYVLAYDVHDPLHVIVTEDEIVKDGDGWIYTLRIKASGRSGKYMPKRFLQPGTVYFPVTTLETEFSQNYSSIPEFSGGVREYINHVGYTRAQISYSVTREAAKSKFSNNATIALEQAKQVIEMYKFRDGSFGANLNLRGESPVSAYTKQFGGAAAEMMDRDIVESAWVPRTDALAMSMLELMVETEAIFGAGGTVEWDGKGSTQTSLGLFHQFNMGNTISFNLYDLSLTQFEFFLAQRLKDRIEPFGSTQNVIQIVTGRGGFALAKSWMRGLPSQNGLVWNADKFVQGANASGPNQSLHFATPDFISYDMMNGYGRVEFHLNPGLDPIEANEYVNPIVPISNNIGGHRLSSYMFMISDIIENGDNGNVLELVYGPDWDFEKSVIVGKLPYMGQSRYNGAYQRSNHHPGYKVILEKRHKAYFLKDATKSLLIKPLNPRTGRPIFSGFFQD